MLNREWLLTVKLDCCTFISSFSMVDTVEGVNCCCCQPFKTINSLLQCGPLFLCCPKHVFASQIELAVLFSTWCPF
ncbi:hypothetical protein VIGAN_01466200 [Vigna angularis var. angularis]|uniref:Uncharacterized protein n=1 Tax=Vigna angularis var. angularis TaxID=157739 RepID=A0A0S3R7P4_PHAAN|nr:hypothetical protein VIGAN_01466200 [Vigna angularis var. angularis]